MNNLALLRYCIYQIVQYDIITIYIRTHIRVVYNRVGYIILVNLKCVGIKRQIYGGAKYIRTNHSGDSGK